MTDQNSHHALGATFFSIGCAFVVIGLAGQSTFFILGVALLGVGLAQWAKSSNASSR